MTAKVIFFMHQKAGIASRIIVFRKINTKHQ